MGIAICRCTLILFLTSFVNCRTELPALIRMDFLDSQPFDSQPLLIRRELQLIRMAILTPGPSSQPMNTRGGSSAPTGSL